MKLHHLKQLGITFIVALLVLALSGCGGSASAPVINKSPNRKIPVEIVVSKGESIYAISWRYGLDYLAIARWNGIKPPYNLKTGQRLALRQGARTTPVIQAPAVVSKPLPAASKPVAAPKPATAPSTSVAAAKPLKPPSSWRWPAKGELVSKFSSSKGINGIRIGGQAGSPIVSTAAGDVVYVGDGLRGYGNLIIVKHSEKFLSAYAHNRTILVNEGQRVKAGQQIAEMGSSGTNRNMLHFEIRVNGTPQDPLKYLGG